jgi:hypothetical protein
VIFKKNVLLDSFPVLVDPDKKHRFYITLLFIIGSPQNGSLGGGAAFAR